MTDVVPISSFAAGRAERDPGPGRAAAGRADATPLIPSPYMSARAGGDFLLKMETMQPIGAFKLRGAANTVLALPDGVAGVVCCSTGNHGRAVAYAAGARGLRAVLEDRISVAHGTSGSSLGHASGSG